VGRVCQTPDTGSNSKEQKPNAVDKVSTIHVSVLVIPTIF